MDFIKKNIKIIGVINIALTVIVMLFEVFDIFSEDATSIDRVFYIAILVSLIAGLIYAFCLYKKKAANYYKLFIIVYALTLIDSIIAHIAAISNSNGLISYDFLFVCNVISTICVNLLAFVPNLGERKSLILSISNFVISLIMFIANSFGNTAISNAHGIVYGMLLLSWITVVFITEKYVDKKSRGAK